MRLTFTTLPVRRVLFLGLALVIVALVAGLGATSFERRLETFQPLGLEAQRELGTAWRVTAAAPRIGVEVGDEILFVEGRSIGDAEELRRQLRGRAESKVVVKRGEELETVTYRRPPLDVDVTYLILSAIGVFYLLIGFYTVLKDRQQQARLFFLWCMASATLFAVSPIEPAADLTARLLVGADQLARTLLPALTFHLFLIFPTRLLARTLERRVLALVYGPIVVLLAFHAELMAGTPRLFGPVTAAKVALVGRIELYLLILAALLAAATLIVRIARRPEVWEQRRQLQWILCGLLGGYVPFLLLYAVPYSLDLGWPAWSESLAVLPLGLVPLAFAWAILKYKLLDFGIILRNSVAYALTGLVGLFGYSLLHLAIQSGVGEDLAVARTLLTFVAGLAIAGVLAPTKNAISTGLEHFQYRGSAGQRQVLNELGQDLLHERDLDRLCATLIEHLADGLVVRANLYLAQGAAMVPVAPGGELPRELAFDALGEELWERDTSSVSAVQLPSEEVSAAQRLFAAGYRYAFPLTVREHRLGVALLSYKYDDEPLNSEDLDLARGLLNQASLAIENAQLLEEVHRRLIEVTRLEEYSNGILESSPAGIAVLDPRGRVLSANLAFAAVAGVPRPETLGRAVEELLPIRPLPEPGDGLVEVSFCEVSGQERYLQLSTARHHEGNELRILIVQDVSERIAMEQALKEKERLASLGMLAAGVAHEVNTPLTGISSYAQLLLSEVDEGHPQYEILKKMERQTFRAAQIVNNLLEFARNRRDELAPLALPAVVGECVELLAERAAAAGVEIRWQPPATPPKVSGNEGELHQVFTNLVVNAIDAISAGGKGGRIAITMEESGQRVRTRVSDDGPGIPPERLETIFRPFFSSKLNKGGSGLGLAITYNIVRRHGGEIRAENNAGARGCTFVVELPRQEAGRLAG